MLSALTGLLHNVPAGGKMQLELEFELVEPRAEVSDYLFKWTDYTII